MSVKRRGIWLAVAVLAGALGVAPLSCDPQDPAAPESGGYRTSGKAAYVRLADVPEQVKPDGTTILVGDPRARMTVHLYEDPRCPYCQEFETSGGGPVLAKWALRRKVKVEYTMASFLDERLGGHGSRKAVNALRAALEEGKFAEYHAVLYRNQPPEEEDGFTDARLLQLASQVKGLRSQSFDAAVKSMKYQDFVDASEKAYDAAGDDGRGPGTPTAEMDGYRIPQDYAGIIYEADLFDKLISRMNKPV